MSYRLSAVSFRRIRSSFNIEHYLMLPVLLGLTALLCGCMSGGTTRRTASVQSARNVESSAAELSARNQSLLGVYSAEIEAAADKIMRESSSLAARRQALEWKAEAIPILQNTLLQTDAVAATVDTWAFIYQMKAYMEQPAVRPELGQQQPIAIETLNRMDGQMEQLVKAAAPNADIPDLRKRIGSWATAHPIQTGLPGRDSMGAKLIRQLGQADLGAVASIRALQEGLGDITARLDAYNIYAPKQARWQAQLLLIPFRLFLTRSPAARRTRFHIDGAIVHFQIRLLQFS